MPSPIEDYALVGDCETAAIIGRDGSVDWLCWPRFDSDACFAALLGGAEQGRWLLAPSDRVGCVTQRRYRDDTLILETRFDTADGAVLLIDFMPPRSGHSNLVRVVVGKRGHIPMRTELAVRFGYGATVPWVHRQEDGTLHPSLRGESSSHCSGAWRQHRRSCARAGQARSEGRFSNGSGCKRFIRAPRRRSQVDLTGHRC